MSKWIEGYEDLYKIYPNGDVERYYKNGNTIILKHRINKDCYKFVCLSKNNKQKLHKIHRLIAIHFIENLNDYPFVDHIDRDRQNNNLENLRWVTISINNRNRKNQGEYLKGVRKKNKKFAAQISIDRKHIYLGTFDTEIEAHNCYMKEYNKIIKDFNNL